MNPMKSISLTAHACLVRRAALLLAILCLFAFGLTATRTPGAARAQEPPPAPMWIWAGSSARLPDTVFFRHRFRLPPMVTSARLAITADNSYKITINQSKRPVFQGSDWTTIQEYDVTRFVKPGENLFAIECVNAGGAGGLIYRLTARTSGGQTVTVVSNAEVRYNRRVPPDWTLLSIDDTKWSRAAVVAPANGGVWGQLYGLIQSD